MSSIAPQTRFTAFYPAWSGLPGKPFVVVSPNGPGDGGDFGPNTPGTTTAGIQEALNTGNSVLVNEGTYGLSAGIVLKASGQVLNAVSLNTKLVASFANSNVITIMNLNNCVVSGFTINAGGSTVANNGIYIAGFSSYNLIEGNYVQNSGTGRTGIIINAATSSDNCFGNIIRGNTVVNSYGSAIVNVVRNSGQSFQNQILGNFVNNTINHGILDSGCTRTLIEGNTVVNTGMLAPGSNTNANGIAVDGNGGANPNNYCTVVGNIVYKTQSGNATMDGIELADSIFSAVCAGNNVSFAAGRGIYWGGALALSKGAVISGNICDSNTQAGIQIDGPNINNKSWQVNVTGNTCTNNGGDGILSGFINDAQIENNLCYVNSGYGINNTQPSTNLSINYNKTRVNTKGPIAFTAGSNVLILNNDGYNPQPASSITVGASPFTYTNNDPYPEEVVISGGTLSAVSLQRGTTTSASAAGDQIVYLWPGDAVVITYSAAPTMEKFPL